MVIFSLLCYVWLSAPADLLRVSWETDVTLEQGNRRDRRVNKHVTVMRGGGERSGRLKASHHNTWFSVARNSLYNSHKYWPIKRKKPCGHKFFLLVSQKKVKKKKTTKGYRLFIHPVSWSITDRTTTEWILLIREARYFGLIITTTKMSTTCWHLRVRAACCRPYFIS